MGTNGYKPSKSTEAEEKLSENTMDADFWNLRKRIPPKEITKTCSTKCCEIKIIISKVLKSRAETLSYIEFYLRKEEVASSEWPTRKETTAPSKSPSNAKKTNGYKIWIEEGEGKHHSFFEIIEFQIICKIDPYKLHKTKDLMTEVKDSITSAKTILKLEDLQSDDKEALEVQFFENIENLNDQIVEELAVMVYREFEEDGLSNQKHSPLFSFFPRSSTVKVELNNIESGCKLGKPIEGKIVIESTGNNKLYHKPWELEKKNFQIDVNIKGLKAEPKNDFTGDEERKHIEADIKVIFDSVGTVIAQKDPEIRIKFTVKWKNRLRGEDEKRIILKDPTASDLDLSMSHNRLILKGELLKANIKAKLPKEYSNFKIKVECQTTDFTKVDPKNGIKEVMLVPDEYRNFNYILSAKRAGFFGYRNQLVFSLTVENQDTPFHTEFLNITVLPNWLDTTIACTTAAYFILSQLFPTVLPPITGNLLDVTTLSSTTASIYLGFRALSWAWTTQKK
jgi:hypothetical protein